MLPDAYGCVVVNRFGELVDDEADPFDAINEAELEKEEKKKKREDSKRAKQKKPGQKESQKDRRLPSAADGAGDDFAGCKQQAHENKVALEVQRGMRRAVYGERRANQDHYPQELSIPKPSHDADFEPRGRGGFRAGRGGRGGRGGYTRNSENFNPGGKREFDRHSGTGMSLEEKRGGRGPWNWGSVQDTMGDLMEVTPESTVRPEEPQEPVEGEDPPSEVDGEMVVQVAMEMTLDEWKALQQMSRPKAEFNLRKADGKVPSKAKVIHQSKNVENKGSMEEESHVLRRSMNDITSRLDINFGSLGRPSRGGRGRGRRGGLAGRPEVAKPKPEEADALAPNPDDPEDFPALTA
ncbi:intracellular hyaluronan-binding protein 4-like [Lampris incognitus]|uniref:intracellular hyaluronan-binding protein 4-like n=1 Tax=Lampris incognitus TaxID=2546036 RepID=UPI0024B59568|nr:intracellular hyaluronan-binding protein 4-like [Lampris incognitus]XP_056137071.1 intracellular hyaluronan-binding protein 4-like [Lampris incognitus]